MSMKEEDFNRLVDEIMSQGYSVDAACDYAVLIGDSPCRDEAGNIIVTVDNGDVIAKLKPLKFFEE